MNTVCRRSLPALSSRRLNSYNTHRYTKRISPQNGFSRSGGRWLFMPKKPTAVFEAVFTGGGVYPEKMPLGKVSEALSAIKRLAMGEVFGAEDDDEDEAENEEVRLIDVQRSASAVFRFFV